MHIVFSGSSCFAHDSLSMFCSANSLVAQLYNVYQSYMRNLFDRTYTLFVVTIDLVWKF